MTTPSLKLLVLKTHNIEALKWFYERLGFDFVEETHGNGPVHFAAALGDGVLEIYPLPVGAGIDSTTRLGFGVANLQSLLNSLDVACRSKTTNWGLRAVVRDPDGRSVELYEST
ncbi:MAG: glyoxalase/bleomycin resistance/extradiol dioxygenase family protein [Planctomycetota bacterium]